VPSLGMLTWHNPPSMARSMVQKRLVTPHSITLFRFGCNNVKGTSVLCLLNHHNIYVLRPLEHPGSPALQTTTEQNESKAYFYRTASLNEVKPWYWFFWAVVPSFCFGLPFSGLLIIFNKVWHKSFRWPSSDSVLMK